MGEQIFRAVLVHRPTDYELLLAAHGTRGQAEFFLHSRGQSIEEAERDHTTIHNAIETVLGRIPARWRRTRITRAELSRFLFEPDDVIIAIGQDGLVANVAKYLSGQLVVGLNPLPERIDGVLVRHSIAAAADLLADIDARRRIRTQQRTMAEARLDDGQSLVALNEIFVGHRSHQSARYRLRLGNREERQSSSGLIVATGTGATGWAKSINGERAHPLQLPNPTDWALALFVREPFPSISTGTSLGGGLIDRQGQLEIVSEMDDGGVVFGDGIEDDRLDFAWGMHVRIEVAEQRLRLVRA
jgi:NAD kinase